MWLLSVSPWLLDSARARQASPHHGLGPGRGVWRVESPEKHVNRARAWHGAARNSRDRNPTHALVMAHGAAGTTTKLG